MVIEAITDRGHSAVVVGGDEIEWEWPGEDGARITVSLDRLILICELCSQEMVGGIIRDYVDSSIAAFEESALASAWILSIL